MRSNSATCNDFAEKRILASRQEWWQAKNFRLRFKLPDSSVESISNLKSQIFNLKSTDSTLPIANVRKSDRPFFGKPNPPVLEAGIY
ncbi:hypothetical protein QUA54_10965 [Microcoleus sp. MOSTC5]|uniref:hypothetical protein n=1 Tax=Microcoleus sp. MOSTC5 TaxID=3055378 RepID=UPI002FD40D51